MQSIISIGGRRQLRIAGAEITALAGFEQIFFAVGRLRRMEVARVGHVTSDDVWRRPLVRPGGLVRIYLQAHTYQMIYSDETRGQPQLVEIAIEPKSKADTEKLVAALLKLAAEDPAFGMSIDRDSGQIILKGASELYLDTKLDALKRTHNIGVRVGALQVAYRERITRRAEAEYTHKKPYGPKGEFAAVKILVEPNEPGKGYQFESKIAGSAMPMEYIPGVEKGIESVLPCGVVAGFPVVDIKVAVIDGKYHDVDSSQMAFEIAARAAFRAALQKAGPVLLEPIIKAEVLTPEDCIGSIIDNLNLRRARIEGQDWRGNTAVISATVPLMSMFGYADKLRAMSKGRATFTMQFDRYAPVALPEDDPPFRPSIGMRV
jgi:elongation factor G